MAAKKNPIEDLVSRTSKFVEKQKGRWDHDAWEKLVKDVSSNGVEMSGDARRHLGNMVEAVKHFYNELSTEPKKKPAKAKSPKTKASVKKKTSAKKKAGVKKKASAKKKAGEKKKVTAKKKTTKKKAGKKKTSSRK
jgi:hypothetical protein